MLNRNIEFKPVTAIDVIETAIRMLEKYTINPITDKHIDFRFTAITHLQTAIRLMRSHYRVCSIREKE